MSQTISFGGSDADQRDLSYLDSSDLGTATKTAENAGAVRLLSHFLASSAVDVRNWYRSTAKAWLVTQSDIFPALVLIYWQQYEKEPWCLTTNLPDATFILRYYRRRMWVEEMFDDFKKHGFDLESTLLRNAPRLSRLTLAVAFLYVWLLSIDSLAIRAGLRFIDRSILLSLSFPLHLCSL